MTSVSDKQSKKIILLIIDTLMDAPLQEAMIQGRAPALEFLMQRGKYFSDVVSSFPTMSVTIDSTLLTGTYSNTHKIPGLVWYSEKEKRIINYGTGLREAYKLGSTQVMQDMFFHLNNVHLSKEVKTIYEELADKGKNSASINGFVYRGNTKHILHMPRLLRPFTKISKKLFTQGPTILSLGSLAKLKRKFVYQILVGNSKSSAQDLKYIIKKGMLPTFTICFFQELDLKVHSYGPNYVKGIEKVDRQVRNILNTYSSWNEALQNNIWIIMGDNGQTTMCPNMKNSTIDLRRLLRSYQIARITRPIKHNDQIVFCVNQRMSFIYILDKNICLSTVASQLQKDNRIDIVCWKEDSFIHVLSGVKEGKLRFKQDGQYRDKYEQTWTLEGNTNILDISVYHNQHIEYGSYPDALARLYSSLHSHDGNYLVVNAKPGYEFTDEYSPRHYKGAAHGSLYKQESLVPMIIAGTDIYPRHSRIVDIKDWILKLSQ